MAENKSAAGNKPPTNSRPAIVFGMAVILFGLGSFGAWASISRLSSAIIGSGIVKVVSESKLVQAVNAGTVKEIHISNGTRVSAGDILVSLDDTAARAALEIIQSNYDLKQATIARLRAERDDAETITFPKSLLALSGDPDVGELLSSQRQLFQSERRALHGQIDLIREQVRQFGEQIKGLEAQSAAVSDRIAISEREYADMQALYKKNLVANSRVLDLERSLSDMKGTKADLDAKIAATQAQSAQADLQILQLRLSFERDANDKLGTAQADLLSLSQQLLDARHTLEQGLVRAPVGGVVVGLNVNTVGAVVQPGTALLEIVPVDDDLIVEARIRPVDIDNVAPDLNAEVTFPGLPRRELPRLFGTVSYVSASAMSDQRTGETYFVARVTLPPEELAKLGDHKLLPDMPAEVFIKAGEKSPLAYLTEPLVESFNHAWREP